MEEKEFFENVVSETETAFEVMNGFCAENKGKISNLIETLETLKLKLEGMEDSDISTDSVSWDDAHNRITNGLKALYGMQYFLGSNY